MDKNLAMLKVHLILMAYMPLDCDYSSHIYNKCIWLKLSLVKCHDDNNEFREENNYSSHIYNECICLKLCLVQCHDDNNGFREENMFAIPKWFWYSNHIYNNVISK